MEALASQSFRFVDLSHCVDRDFASEHLYLDSYHFGDKGNEAVAAAIADAIRDLLPAK
jgi:lysophospholipase L1-like esterase